MRHPTLKDYVGKHFGRLTVTGYHGKENGLHCWESVSYTHLEEGQQIIPVSYTIPVSVYKQSEVTYTPSRETTWMEMLETEDEALAATAVWTDITGLSKQGSPLMKDRDVLLEFILGDLADYTEEKLLFTEEELQQRFSEVMELADRYTQGEFDSAPLHYNDFLGCYFNQGMFLKDIDLSLIHI